MYLFFIDNSYATINRQDVTCLGGFIIKDEEYTTLRNKIEKLKLQNGLAEDQPIKWSPGPEPRYKKLKELNNQNKFKADVLRVISDTNLSIVVSIINTHTTQIRQLKRQKKITPEDCKRFQAEYENRSIEYMAQRLQMHLQEIGKRVVGFNEKGLMVVETPEHDRVISLIKHYNYIWHHGTEGAFKMKLRLLSDGLVYSHDFGYDGLQLADFIVSSFCHALKNSRYEFVRLYKNRIRSRSGRMKGVGIVVYPSNSLVADNLISAL